MAISVSIDEYGRLKNLDGRFPRRASLTITGLTAAADNTIPHGLPGPPQSVSLRPGSAGLWGEKQAPDATNLYIHVGTGGATAGKIDVIY